MVTTTISKDPTLQLGSQGVEVQELQQLLNKRVNINDQINIDGVFGSKTEAVVKIVQYQFLLEQDGIAGLLTWKSLRAGAPVDKPILQRGSTGEQVSIVQKVLQDCGLYNGSINGDFDSLTQTATEAFQKGHNLLVDGIIGNQTWQALSNMATFLTVD